MTRLTDDSVEFARTHIEAFYDSDFFPKRDEFEALWACWDDVKSHLLNVNVEKMAILPPRSMPAPKARGGYRIVHQLEPLNAITYTALGYMVAPGVEAHRVASDVAFSYRIKLSSSSFFADGNGYQPFLKRCRELSARHPFVLATDIADFYNRIYLHRVANSISAVGCPSGTGRTVETFLMNLNGKTSQGIPIGPAPSIIMAEAVLTDLDQFLANHGAIHARYMDDFRIFGRSREHLEGLLEDLVSHLFDQHRLQVASAKTSIRESSSFAADVRGPVEDERKELLELVQAVCDYGDQYTEADIDNLAKKYLRHAGTSRVTGKKPASRWDKLFALMERRAASERQLIRDGVLSELLAQGASKSPIDLGLVRHALRQGRRWKTPVLVGDALGLFENLRPAMPDVFLYLDAVCSDDVIDKHRDAIVGLTTLSVFRVSRFAQHWTYWFLTSKQKLVSEPGVSQLLWNAAPVEWQLRAARTTRNLTKVRQFKPQVASLGIWDRRALLMASSVLPKDERKPWLQSVVPDGPVEEAIVKWAASQP